MHASIDPPIRSTLRRNAVLRLVAAYPISTYCVLAIGLHSLIVASQYYEIPNHGLGFLRIYTPALFALGVSVVAEGPGAAKANLGSLIKFGVAPKYYLFGMLYPGLVGMVALGCLFAVGAVDQFEFGFSEAHQLGFFELTFSMAAVEEIAWISFVLVLLARRYQLFHACLITGLMWGVWYIPLVLADIQVAPGLPIGPLLLNFVTIAAICGWLYLRTQSAAVVFVMQLTTNYTSQVIPLLPLRGGMAQYVAFVVMKAVFALALYIFWGPRTMFGRITPGTSSLVPVEGRA